ncbi:hypothetical protein ACMFMG_002063 [Clarireedia jacksonii]
MGRLSQRFSGSSARKPSPPPRRLTISSPIPIQDPSDPTIYGSLSPRPIRYSRSCALSSHPIENSESSPLSSPRIRHFESDASLDKRRAGSPKDRNPAPERSLRPDEQEERKENKPLRSRRDGRIFTEKEIEQIFAGGKKIATEEGSKHRSQSTSTSSHSSNEGERRRERNSRSGDRKDPSNSKRSDGKGPSRERGSRVELVEGKEIIERGCSFTLVTRKKTEE